MSIQSRFCLNTATINETPLELQVQLASSARFTRIGLWLADLEKASRRGKPLPEISESLQTAGLKVEEICFLGNWQDTDAEGFARTVQDAHRICQVSQALGCDLVVAVPAQGRGSLDSAPMRFRRICQVAADYGIRIALEFPGTAAEVKDLRTAWHLVSMADCANGGLLLDTFHFFLGGSKVDDLRNVPGEKIFLVHVSDAMDVSREKLKTHHDYRTFPGQGIIEFAPLFEGLADLEYQGPISLEIWNQQLRREDPAELVRKGFDSLLTLGPLLNGKRNKAGNTL
jgi:sugar phosphate isomerase/epimerase